MGLLRDWAERAHDQGRRGLLIERILSDPQFERHSLEAFQIAADRRMGVLQEATTSDFSDLVGKGAAVERAVLEAIGGAEPAYRKFAKLANLTDMKPVKRMRRSDTDRFQAVLEGGEAIHGGFSSHTVEYDPQKFELTLDFTWEMLINDDLGAFKNIGADLAQGAANTINQFVAGLLTSSDDIYDGAPLFDASHSNSGVTALSGTSLQAGITAMRSHLSERGNALHIVPGFLVVPPELEFTAKTLVHSTLVPGGTNNDVNVLNGIVEVVVEPLLTDANNWYLIATPQSIPTLELGFLHGKESPEVLVREDFERDVLNYKGRLAMGGAVLDYRAFYGGIVA